MRGVLAKRGGRAWPISAVGLLPLGYAWQKVRVAAGRARTRAHRQRQRHLPLPPLLADRGRQPGERRAISTDLKARRPATFVRLSTAGLEGSYELATATEKVQFFYQPRTFNAPLLWQIYLLNSFTLATCASLPVGLGHPRRRDRRGHEPLEAGHQRPRLHGLGARSCSTRPSPTRCGACIPRAWGSGGTSITSELTAAEQGASEAGFVTSPFSTSPTRRSWGFDAFSIGRSGARG